MNDLRSLEGVGQLLSQKLNQNHKHKLKPRHRSTNSATMQSIISTPTPTSNTTPITDYFPPPIAQLLSNNIHNGYYKPLPSKPHPLVKSHSDFIRNDLLHTLSYDDIDDNEHEHEDEDEEDEITAYDGYVEADNESLDTVDSIETAAEYQLQPYNHQQQTHCVVLDLPEIAELHHTKTARRSNSELVIPPPIMVSRDSQEERERTVSPTPMAAHTHDFYESINPKLSISAPPPPPLAPLLIEKSYSTGIDAHHEGLFISLDEVDQHGPEHEQEQQRRHEQEEESMVSVTNTTWSEHMAILNYADDDEMDDDLPLFNVRGDYMEYKSAKQKSAFNNIGNGASGIVRKAFHYQSCQMVAIKQCRSKQQHELDAFIKECRLYGEFAGNENIVDILEYGRDIQDGDLMMALEYMDLGSTDKLKIDEIFSLRQRELVVGHIIFNVLKALRDLHKNLYVHNDVKPGNILCNKYGEVKLSDFGTVCKLQSNAAYLTKNNGTQKYQSPEKLTKCPKYNTKSDVWSVGVTAYELIFGGNAHQSTGNCNELSYINQFRSHKNLLVASKHKLSANCCDFINQCLTFDENQRPSVEQLLHHKWFAKEIKSTPLLQKWPWRKEVNLLTATGGRHRDDDEKLVLTSPESASCASPCSLQRRRSFFDLTQHPNYNEDLLFMISALIIHYSTQSVNLSPKHLMSDAETEPLSRRRSGHWTSGRNGDYYSDDERIANIAHCALCSKEMVVERIRVTVAYIKSRLNKAEISRIDS
eukprot:CAMPEP_0197035216 /NCGR_PEP_ID=MMETSP1384-20130603/13073_1 /TAXON_ID=29189 /ORGANISM="Ammonia sp." /LENGTH=756 /DNA_ID=CAMNT_0042465245 /DNA_START=73 /DNA_END=2343 /DNA_ORIENTATION=+